MLPKKGRRMSLATSFACLITASSIVFESAAALRLDLQHVPRTTKSSLSRVSRRAGLGRRAGGSLSDLQNDQDLVYAASINVGGDNFLVQLDTGSSDLWVAGKVNQASDTQKTATVTYGSGEAEGEVFTTTVQALGATISNQAFIQNQDFQTFPGLQDFNIDGLVGVGPPIGSQIRGVLGSPTGNTVLENILLQNKANNNNYMTFLFSRNDSKLSNQPTSQFTLGETLPNFGNITSQTKLPIRKVNDGNQHYTVKVDSVTGPDGNTISTSSTVSNLGSNSLALILDTGTSFVIVPRAVSDAIYGKVNGAQFDTQEGAWLIPCEQELNVTFTIGGVKIPINPLDLSTTTQDARFSNGKTACVGTFQPATQGLDAPGEFDGILGDSFLKNVYALISPGSLISGLTNDDPFAQLVGLTTPESGHADFVTSRLGGKDTTGDSQFKLKSQGQTSPSTPGESTVDNVENFFDRHKIPILIGAGVVGLILLLSILSCCFRRRGGGVKRNRQRNFGSGTVGGGAVPFGESQTDLSAPNQRQRNRRGGGGMFSRMRNAMPVRIPFMPAPPSYRQVEDPRSAPGHGNNNSYPLSNHPPPLFQDNTV